MKKDTAIKVQNISKVYKLYSKPIDRLKESLNPFGKKYHKEFYALKNVSFEIKKGETVGIIGRNGSGKSTILKIITGVLQPSSGKVIVNGKISAILELSSGLNPEMNGIENIYLNATINGLTKEEIDKKLKEIIEFSELEDFIYQPLKMYSSGMRARLAFSIAINVDPDILIVDEALAVGDVAFQRKCFARMEEIRQKGATILFVSHSATSINTLCNRAIWLHKGDMILDGKPKLVTGLYMKYGNKNEIDKNNIIREFKELITSSDSEKSDKYEKNNKIVKSKIKNINKNLIGEYYDPSLMPKSTIHYEEKGARISDVKLITLEGNKVNVINHNRKYKIQMQVEVFTDLEDVRFGTAIRNTQGVYYAGAAYELLKHAKQNVLKRGKYTISFEFNCMIVEGVYVIDVAILSDWNKNKVIEHKINDAYLFKVLKEEKDNIEQSHIALLERCEIEKIN